MNSIFDFRKNLSVVVKLLVLALVALGGIWLLYSLSGREGKDSINKFAAQTGIGKQVIPWSDRAETAARKLVEANRQNIANAIQVVTHPTGKEPTLSQFNISKLGDRILVDLVVAWKGGILGSGYSTSVVWEIGERGHLGAKVTADSALTKVSETNKEVLNDYFRTKVYPAFFSDMGG